MNYKANRSLRRVPPTVLLALAMFIPEAARAEITPEAAQVLARHLDAVGGADVVRAVRTTHIKAKVQAFGLTGTTESWAEAPDRHASLGCRRSRLPGSPFAAARSPSAPCPRST